MDQPDLGAWRRAQLAAARLYLVCDAQPGGRQLAEVIHEAIAGGVQVVQLREKLLGDEELTAVAHAAQVLCRELGALLIVNDRPHVALHVGADGVHVGQEDMAIGEVRGIVGEEMLVGLSTHTPSEIDAARPNGRDGARYVDYIGVGPVHATPTKPGRPAVGTELVGYASAHAQVPFFAIGGLDEGNVEEVLAAGAERVCVLRAICEAQEPERAARRLRTRLDSHQGNRRRDGAPR